MYYCQTRYFVPEWGRWLNADNVGFLQFDNINGMNLFAYCNNNPVMYADPSGEFIGSLIAGIIIGGLLSGSISAISAAVRGEDSKHCWGAFVGGFITGAALGAATVLGGGLVVGAVKATALNISLISAYVTAGTFGAGVGAYAVETLISGEQWNIKEAFANGAITMTQGILSFGIGAAMGSAGMFECLKSGKGLMDAFKVTSAFFKTTGGGNILKTIFYGSMAYLGENLYPMIARSFMKGIFTSAWNLIKY